MKRIHLFLIFSLMVTMAICMSACGDDNERYVDIDVDEIVKNAPGTWDVISVSYRNDKRQIVDPPQQTVEGGVLILENVGGTYKYKVTVNGDLYDEGTYTIGTLYFRFNTKKQNWDTKQLQIAKVEDGGKTLQLNLKEGDGTYLFTIRKR